MQGHSTAQAQTWAVQGCQHSLQVAFKRQAGRSCSKAARGQLPQGCILHTNSRLGNPAEGCAGEAEAASAGTWTWKHRRVNRAEADS